MDSNNFFFTLTKRLGSGEANDHHAPARLRKFVAQARQTYCSRACVLNYRKRGSASYIVREVLSVREREREREIQRERDGSDVTIFARLAMNSHFHLPKIRTIGDELTLSLAKNSHFSFLPSHFPSLPSRRGDHCGAEIRNEFTLSIAKKFSPSLFPLFQMARAARRVIENPKQMIKSCPVLFCSSH